MYLPPLNALRAFEAAGRHQSFLLAAQELHVSSASVSRFVKVLENDLRQELFYRKANGVFLTEKGEEYLRDIQPHLNALSRISGDLKHKNLKETLTLVSIPAVAEIWLVSRLWSFQQQYKDIQINLEINYHLLNSAKPITLKENDSKIILNYSDGSQHGTASFPMPKDQLTVVCNPEIASTLHSLEDIFKYPLLVDIDWKEDWQVWLEVAFELTSIKELPAFKTATKSEFERYSMILHATLAGSGIAIGHTSLLKSYLDSGALVAPFDIQAVAEKQFRAVTAKNSNNKAVQAFSEWFVSGD